uniref:hypothetical protein n=1 Tax=Orrella sp. TaxID=1921583 RepID=UPI00404862C9
MTESELQFKAQVESFTRPSEFEKLIYERSAGFFSRADVKRFVSRLLTLARVEAKSNAQIRIASNELVAELLKAQCDWAKRLTKM